MIRCSPFWIVLLIGKIFFGRVNLVHDRLLLKIIRLLSDKLVRNEGNYRHR